MSDSGCPPASLTINVTQALQQAIARHCLGRSRVSKSHCPGTLQAQFQYPEASFRVGLLASRVEKTARELRILRTRMAIKWCLDQCWRKCTDALSPAKPIGLAKQELTEARQQGFQSDIIDEFTMKLEGR